MRDGRLVQTNETPIPSPPEFLKGETFRSKFGDLIGMMRTRYEWRSGRTSALTKELTFALLDEIRRTAESGGAKAAFAYLPVHGEIPRKDDGMTSREKAFFNGSRDRGLTALYLQPAFRERARAGATFKTEGHWGPLEHRIGAEAIAASLRELGWIR